MFTSKFLSNSFRQKSGAQLDNSLEFDRLWTDSRTLKPTDFFIPLKGEKFDGHDFLKEALQKGVKGFLVEESCRFEFPKNVLVLRTGDTLKGFRKITAAWREKFSIPVIAVCGSVGKTTTKELLASLLSGRFRVAKTESSQNGFVGIPMTLATWDESIEVTVVEIGIDAKGTMEDHLEVVKPTHGIITALGPEHLEQLGNIDGVFEEETKLFSWLEKTAGKAFFNLDEPLFRGRIEPKKNFLTFSLDDPKADFLGILQGKQLTIQYENTRVILPLVLPGIHNARNLLGAVSIALSLGLNEKELEQGLRNFSLPKYRMEIKKTKQGATLLCDYYNANPSSMEAAFQVLKEEFPSSPKILVLGDMLELGTQDEEYHRGLATSIQSIEPKKVLLFGSRMNALKEELLKKKVPFPVQCFSEKEKLSGALWQEVATGDAVLIKGSRSMRMEELVPASLLADSK